MTTLRRTLRFTVAAIVAASLLAACDGDDPSVEAGGGGQTDERTLVLRMQTIGGFLPPEEHFRMVPSVSVYSDGLVITQGAQI
ncbi:MAG TPA: hypothetical protein VM618_08935, partial [Acidimicrobiia bacterium]|nr:hypothetical protein [Acidimicrobiia bacterium]